MARRANEIVFPCPVCAIAATSWWLRPSLPLNCHQLEGRGEWEGEESMGPIWTSCGLSHGLSPNQNTYTCCRSCPRMSIAAARPCYSPLIFNFADTSPGWLLKCVEVKWHRMWGSFEAPGGWGWQLSVPFLVSPNLLPLQLQPLPNREQVWKMRRRRYCLVLAGHSWRKFNVQHLVSRSLRMILDSWKQKASAWGRLWIKACQGGIREASVVCREGE